MLKKLAGILKYQYNLNEKIILGILFSFQLFSTYCTLLCSIKTMEKMEICLLSNKIIRNIKEMVKKNPHHSCLLLFLILQW